MTPHLYLHTIKAMITVLYRMLILIYGWVVILIIMIYQILIANSTRIPKFAILFISTTWLIYKTVKRYTRVFYKKAFIKYFRYSFMILYKPKYPSHLKQKEMKSFWIQLLVKQLLLKWLMLNNNIWLKLMQ